MNKQSICRCVIASILSVTATAWAQTSVGLGRADYKENCASCHGASGKGDGPVHSFLVKPPSDLTQIAQRHGGKFPQELMWEVIDGRWRATRLARDARVGQRVQGPCHDDAGRLGHHRRVVGTQPHRVLAQVPGDDPAAVKVGSMRWRARAATPVSAKAQASDAPMPCKAVRTAACSSGQLRSRPSISSAQSGNI